MPLDRKDSCVNDDERLIVSYNFIFHRVFDEKWNPKELKKNKNIVSMGDHAFDFMGNIS